MSNEVSYFKDFNTPDRTVKLTDILKVIKDGIFKEKIEKLRNYLKKGDKEKYDQGKKQLTSFTSTGTFSPTRKADNIQEYSQIITLDIDKISSIVDEIKKEAEKIEETLAVFLSPSGQGLKVLVKINSKAKDHKAAYKCVVEHYTRKLKIPLDEKTDDISRLCFISYDPNLFYNPNAKIFKTVEKLMEKKYRHAIKLTEKKHQFKEGSRNIYIHLLSWYCNLLGVSENHLIDQIADYEGEGFTDIEIIATIRSVYKNHKKDHDKWSISESAVKEGILTPKIYQNFKDITGLRELKEIEYLRLLLSDEREKELNSLCEDYSKEVIQGFDFQEYKSILSDIIFERTNSLDNWDINNKEHSDLFLPCLKTTNFTYPVALKVMLLSFKAEKIHNFYRKIVLKSQLLNSEETNQQFKALQKLKNIHDNLIEQISILITSFDEVQEALIKIENAKS